MDWILLLLLVPLVIIPIVLLCGFSGCGLDVAGTGPVISTPTNLKATATKPTRVDLQWIDTTSVQNFTDFSIERGRIGQVIAPINQTTKGSSFADTSPGLEEGTTFLYRVRPVYPPLTHDPSNTATVTTPPLAPSGLTATVAADIPVGGGPPVGPPKIELRWTNNSAQADGFILRYRTGAGVFVDLPLPVAATPPPSQATFTHTGLLAGTTYEYEVVAYVDGYDHNGLPAQIRSEPSPPASATTPGISPIGAVWKPAFSQALTANTVGNQNDCIVQRLPAPFAFSGSKVKITVRSSTTAPTNLKRIYISQPAAAGEPYDSAGDLTKVLETPPGATVPGNQELTFGPIDYNLDKTKDLLVAFDMGSPSAGRRGARTGATYFTRNLSEEAATADRSATGYNDTNNFVFLIQSIEVLTTE